MVLRNVMLNKNDNVFVGSRIVIKGGGMVLNIFRLSFGSFIGGIYFIVIMIFIYRDGVLNLWQFVFVDNLSFFIVVSVFYYVRRCGYRYFIINILVYLELSLMFLTLSYEMEIRKGEDSWNNVDLLSLLDGNRDKFRKFYSNEFIVWKVESVLFLRQSGGVMEFIRVNSLRFNVFMNIVWVLTLFLYLLILFDSSILILFYVVVFCVCFLVLDGICYRFY